MSPLLPLLALLARGDAYGYELKQRIAAEFAPHWRIDFAQLYRTLARLHAQELVRVRAVSSDAGPARKQYAITARGRAAVDAWFAERAESHKAFWVKLRLASALGYDTQFLIGAERERMEDERRSRASSALVPSAQPRFAPAGSLPLPLVFAGSDDVLLARLAQETNALWQVNGSTAGLAALASSNADVAGAHLREPDAAEFNISFVQHLIAEQDVLLVQLAVREYGLLVAPGNPNGIRRVRDLARDKLCLLNRARGSGARLWLLRHLRAARLDPATLSGWTSACTTYDEIARAIVNGKADVGPGLRATAEQYELDFVPLGTERFDLAVTRALYESRRGDKLQEVLHRKDFLAYAQALPGYDVARSGRVIAHIRYGQRRKQ